MSKSTGVKGYTPDRLRRSKDAEARKQARAARSPTEQLALLDERSGAAAKEREKLERWQ